MAGTSLTTAVRRRLYTFAGGIARQFSDSRRRRFLTDMLTGLVAAGHVHLTAVARANSRGAGNIHAAEKRLSRTWRANIGTRRLWPIRCSAGPPLRSGTTP